MHLAVFGGSFDPPHNGHLALCLFARELLAIDRIIISASNNPFKRNRTEADGHRKRMATLLSSEINSTGVCSEVSSWELQKKEPSYTVDLLLYLHQLYPGVSLTLLIGEDNFREFSQWKSVEKIFSLCDIVVFRRASADPDLISDNVALQKGAVRFIDFDSQISSCTIRKLALAGHSIARLVPLSVQRYIIEHDLYHQPTFPTSTRELKRQES